MEALTNVVTGGVLLKLREAARKEGLSEVGRRTGIKREQVWQILYKHKNPTLETLARLSLALGFVVDLKADSSLNRGK